MVNLFLSLSLSVISCEYILGPNKNNIVLTLLRQALLKADKSKEQEAKDLCTSIACLAFMGVLSLGFDNTAFLKMTEGQKNAGLIRLLGRDSEFLRKLDEDFRIFSGKYHYKTVAVHECHGTKTLKVCRVPLLLDFTFSSCIRIMLTTMMMIKKNQKNQDTGHLEMTGPEELLVNRQSACSPGLGKNVICIPSQTDHVQICKFRSSSDALYCELVDIFEASIRVKTTFICSEMCEHLRQHRRVNFIGREATLSAMHQCLSAVKNRDGGGSGGESHGASVSPVVALCGVPRVGKTATALEYVETQRHTYSRIFQGSLDSSEATLAELERWARLPGETLVVYDQVDDDGEMLRVMKKYHKPRWTGSICVLLMTCNTTVAHQLGDRFIGIECLSNEEGRELLIHRLGSHASGNEDVSLVSKLVHLLKGWPPALEAAAAARAQSGLSLATIVKEVEGARLGILNEDNNSENSSHAGVFDVVLSKMTLGESEVASEKTMLLLNLCSHLGGQISKSLAEKGLRYFHMLDIEFQTSTAGLYVKRVFEIGGSVHQVFKHLLRLRLVEDSDRVWKIHPILCMATRSKPLTCNEVKACIIEAAHFAYAWFEILRLTQGEEDRVGTIDAHSAQIDLMTHVEFLADYCEKALEVNLAKVVPFAYVQTFAL